jgi:hypothetical protein
MAGKSFLQITRKYSLAPFAAQLNDPNKRYENFELTAKASNIAELISLIEDAYKQYTEAIAAGVAH